MDLADKMTGYALNEWLAPFTEEEAEDFKEKCRTNPKTVNEFLGNLIEDVEEYPTDANRSLLTEVTEHYKTLTKEN